MGSVQIVRGLDVFFLLFLVSIWVFHATQKVQAGETGSLYAAIEPLLRGTKLEFIGQWYDADEQE